MSSRTADEILREILKLVREIDERQEKQGWVLRHIDRKVDKMAVGIAEVQEALATLKADLEAKAAEAQAEFAKLEEEVAAGSTEPDLTPLKETIDSLDAAVKASEVPTD